MASTFTAITKKEGDWWIEWIEEVPGVNAQEKTKIWISRSLEKHKAQRSGALNIHPPALCSCRFDRLDSTPVKNMKRSVTAVLLFLAAATASAQDDHRENAKSVDSPKPTFADVSYGPHERNKLDFWQAQGDGPRPVVVFIHGGGFHRGDKSQVKDLAKMQEEFLDKGISCCSINYRYTSQALLPAAMQDAARALQFLRSQAKEWNIDKNKIAVAGNSAGACLSLWLALHDDLADPASSDPVLRESTKPVCAAMINCQTSLDPEWIEKNIGAAASNHPVLAEAFGAKSTEEILKNKDKYQAVLTESSPISHLDKGDPPVYFIYTYGPSLPPKDRSQGIHHPVFGLKFKEQADQAGIECTVSIKNDKSKYGSLENFVREKLSDFK